MKPAPWDLWHYGWPDDIDLFSGEFIDRFVAFSRAALEVLGKYTEVPLISPINEISFFSWAAGDAGSFNPFAKNRGGEVKTQLPLDRLPRCSAGNRPMSVYRRAIAYFTPDWK